MSKDSNALTIEQILSNSKINVACNVTAKVIKITPKIAKVLLDQTPESIQRPIKRSNVLMLKSELTSGNWAFNGESIVLSNDFYPYVLDGRHRLTAIYETGVEVDVLVVFNVPRASMHTIDRGQMRSLADVIGIEHKGQIKYQACLASVLSRIHASKNRNIKLAEQAGSGGRGSTITSSEAIDLLSSDKEIYQSVLDGMKMHGFSTTKILPPSVLCFVLYILRKTYSNEYAKINSYLEELITGKGLDGGLCYILREKIIRNNKKEASIASVAATVIVSFDKYLKNIDVKAVRWVNPVDLEVII